MNLILKLRRILKWSYRNLSLSATNVSGSYNCMEKSTGDFPLEAHGSNRLSSIYSGLENTTLPEIQRNKSIFTVQVLIR
jgi:hypothetical protein